MGARRERERVVGTHRGELEHEGAIDGNSGGRKVHEDGGLHRWANMRMPASRGRIRDRKALATKLTTNENAHDLPPMRNECPGERSRTMSSGGCHTSSSPGSLVKNPSQYSGSSRCSTARVSSTLHPHLGHVY